MEKQKCPWYVWIFSFFALFVLAGMTMFQVGFNLIRKKVKYELWLKLFGELLLDWGVLFMLPISIFSELGTNFLPSVWNWLGAPIAYALGVYPVIRMWRWRERNLPGS